MSEASSTSSSDGETALVERDTINSECTQEPEDGEILSSVYAIQDSDCHEHPPSVLSSRSIDNSAKPTSSLLSGTTFIPDDGAPIPVSQSIRDDIEEKHTSDTSHLTSIELKDHEKNSPIPIDYSADEDALKKQTGNQQASSLSSDLPTVLREDNPPVPISDGIYPILSSNNLEDEAVTITLNPEHLSNEATHDQEEAPSTSNLQESGTTSNTRGINTDTRPGPTDSDDILVPEAFLITDDEIDIDASVEVDEIPSAQVVVPDKYSLTLAGKQIHVGVLAVVIFVLISLEAGLLVWAILKNKDDINSTKQDAPKDYRGISIQNVIETNVLRRNSTFGNLPSDDSRREALDWILHTDPMKLNVWDSNIHQRYILSMLGIQYNLRSDSDWLSDTSECEWHGVSCFDNKVRKLELGGLGLTGTLPPEVGGLNFLESLILSYNSFTGTLPPEICNILSLDILDIRANQLTGILPSSIGTLFKLSTLDISDNLFTGSLPSSIGTLSKLTALGVSYNMISGSLPKEIGSLKGLSKLFLASNAFSGTLPTEVGYLTGLIYLYLDHNAFSGALPTEIGYLTELEQVHLEVNSFSGTIPIEIGLLANLYSLDISNNEFTGVVPQEILCSPNLFSLFLENNMIDGNQTIQSDNC